MMVETGNCLSGAHDGSDGRDPRVLCAAPRACVELYEAQRAATTRVRGSSESHCTAFADRHGWSECAGLKTAMEISGLPALFTRAAESGEQFRKTRLRRDSQDRAFPGD